MTEFRLCKKCRREKLLLDFPVYDRKNGLRRHECLVCHNSRMNVHYLRNKDYRLQRAQQRYAAKPSSVRTAEEKQRVNERSKGYRQTHFQIILDHYGARCVCCGEDQRVFLTIDHKNDDGGKFRNAQGVSLRFYRWIIKNNFPDDLQILCYNCNCGRARNGGVCPHVADGSTIIPQGSRAKWPEALSDRKRSMI